MSKKLYPADTIQQAKSALVAWNQIDPSLRIGTTTPEAFQAEVDAVEALKDRIAQLQLEILELRNQRDEACIGVWNRVKSVRSFMKGIFGDDSTEYQLVGGTRRSEIKRKHRKSSAEQKDEPYLTPQ